MQITIHHLKDCDIVKMSQIDLTFPFSGQLQLKQTVSLKFVADIPLTILVVNLFLLGPVTFLCVH